MITALAIALVQHYAPELDRRCRPHLNPTTDSWRVDETSVKVQETWMYLSRAVDSAGNTLGFRLSPTRAALAAKRFFSQALTAAHPVTPRVITVDTNAAYPKALTEFKAPSAVPAGCELRQVKYLNHHTLARAPLHQTAGQARPGLLLF